MQSCGRNGLAGWARGEATTGELILEPVHTNAKHATTNRVVTSILKIRISHCESTRSFEPDQRRNFRQGESQNGLKPSSICGTPCSVMGIAGYCSSVRRTIPIWYGSCRWLNPFRRVGVRANADIPRDAVQARAFGAEGIGLCRTEHMFFAKERINHMRAMILATTEKDRRAALKKLLPLQRKDFIGVFRAMDGFPVTIRLLDPPLHEFLPRREDLMVEIAVLEATKPKSPKLGGLKKLLRRVEDLH